MTEKQRRYINLVLATLELLVPGAREYLLGLVKDLNDQDIDWTALIALLERAAKAAPQWKAIARAWMLVQVLPLYKIYGRFPSDKQSLRDYEGFIGHIAAEYDNMWAYQEDLISEIVEQLLRTRSARSHREQIDLLQVHGSRSAWAPARFTSATAHNPLRYCYIVHAMRPLSSLPRGTPTVYAELLSMIGQQYLTDGDVGTLVNLHTAQLFLDRPEMLTGEILSCSVISPEHTRTYSSFSFGFILHVPATNIVMAGPRDLQASYFQNLARPTTLAGESLLVRARANDEMFEGIAVGMSKRLDDPPTILSGSSPLGHNEVLVLGRNGSSRVRPTALFIKVTRDGCLWASFLRDDAQYGLRAHILACSQRLRIPIIPIVEDAAASSVTLASWYRGIVAPRLLLGPPLQVLPMPSELALVPSSGSLALCARSLGAMRSYEITGGSGVNQVRLLFQLPEIYTTRDVVELFLPLYRRYQRELLQLTSDVLEDGPAVLEQSALQLVERSEPVESIMLRKVFALIEHLLSDASDNDQSTSIARGLLTWK